MEATATRRAAFAKAIARYGDRDPDPATNLIDLLADVRHWCDRHGQELRHAGSPGLRPLPH